MKKVVLFVFISIGLFGFYSCDDDSDIVTFETQSESISMGEGYAMDIYYSLSNGVVSEVERTNWDIAFSVGAMSSSILINEGAGVVLKEYPTTDGWNWNDAIDTLGYTNWNALYNSDENWEEGAFGQNATGHPNYGWGEYNDISHNVEGVAMYIIKLSNGDYKRIFVEIKSAMDQEYIFIYSDLDGSNEVSETVSFADLSSNFIYYSMVNQEVISNREPATSTWDLLFTKYIDNSIEYPVAGIIQNTGVLAIDEDDAMDLTITTYLDSEFDDNITEIGSDWKDFDMTTFQYVVDDDRIYFVKDQNENVYKIVFMGFEGSSTGNITFDVTTL